MKRDYFQRNTDKNFPAAWYLAWMFVFTCPAFAVDDPPKFEAADVHVSARSPNAALKLEKRKRTQQMVAIDHLEQKPTETRASGARRAS